MVCPHPHTPGGRYPILAKVSGDPLGYCFSEETQSTAENVELVRKMGELRQVGADAEEVAVGVDVGELA